MNILPPAAPQFAVQIIDGDKALGTLDLMPAAEATRALYGVQQTYPESALVELDEDGLWASVTDEQVKRATYAHTAYVVGALIFTDLPLASWDLGANVPDRAQGSFFIDDVEQSREALQAYADVLDAGEIAANYSEHGLHLSLPVVERFGVRIEMKAYVPKHRLPACVDCGAIQSLAQQRDHGSDELVWLCEPCHSAGTGAPVECAECESTGQNCAAHREPVKAGA